MSGPAGAPLRVVVVGLSISSSWGNGHATTYRALLKAFAARGHDVLFLERDQPWYAAHRDLAAPGFCRLALYPDLAGLRDHAPAIREADAVIVGSYVPDGVAVGRWVQETARLAAFYDIDTPVTLAKLARDDHEYLSPDLIPGYRPYLSFTGGPTLDVLEGRYGSPMARALYCTADPDLYRPLDAPPRWDLSYLGTYSPDRQPVLERLLLEPARRAPDLRFVVAGPQYPADTAWPSNVEHLPHVGPADHPAFYAASRWTLNVTRADMVRAGWSPSVRLFEAGACGTPIISDTWPGLDTILAPGREIIVAEGADDVLGVLMGWSETRRRDLAAAGRAEILSHHAAPHRARELEVLPPRGDRTAAGRRATPPARRGAGVTGAGAMNRAELGELVADCPVLYHVAEAGSWPMIRRHGLLSASALLDLFGVTGATREAAEGRRRPEGVVLADPALGSATLRDQKPMDDASLRRCLGDGLVPADWYRLLNARAFFWLTRARLLRLLDARPYRGRAHDVIEVDSAALVDAHRDRVTLSPINSGATRPFPVPRGRATFTTIADYPYAHWRARRPRGERVVELAVTGGVPDIARLARRVVAMRGDAVQDTIWEKGT